MQRDCKKLKIALHIIVIVIFVAYSFIAYVPHKHDCIDSECVVCNITESLRDMLTSVALITIARLLPQLTLIFSTAYERIVSLCETTPVGLKVKLSD